MPMLVKSVRILMMRSFSMYGQGFGWYVLREQMNDENKLMAYL